LELGIVTDGLAEAPHQIAPDLQRRQDVALTQQAAAADVLKVMSRSSFAACARTVVWPRP
jgi:hypothetical protein